jgi:hypothetical protein
VDGDQVFEYKHDRENRFRQVRYDSGDAILLFHFG